jgi:1-deoxy-D-xylulose-5-phosphate synthase
MATAQRHEGPFAYRYPRGVGSGLPLNDVPSPVPIGKGEKLRDGSDGVIFAIGTCAAPALQAAQMLADEGLSLAVVDPRFLKPLDRDLLIAETTRTGLVITVEENVLQGGFGSAVMELLAQEEIFPRIACIGLPDFFVEQGSQEQLQARYGLDAVGIAGRIRKVLGGARPVNSSAMGN